MEIAPIVLNDAERLKAVNLDLYDIAIFISRSAVRFGVPALQEYWPIYPAHLRWLTTGPGTARVLSDFGVRAEYPEHHSSAGLLAMKILSEVSGKRVIIFRGKGGRETLADELRKRLAEVDYLEVYCRAQSLTGGAKIRQLLLEDSIKYVCITSGEAMDHLARIASEDSIKDHLTILVPSARVAKRAASLGFLHVVEASGADDVSMYRALKPLLSANVNNVS